MRTVNISRRITILIYALLMFTITGVWAAIDIEPEIIPETEVRETVEEHVRTLVDVTFASKRMEPPDSITVLTPAINVVDINGELHYYLYIYYFGSSTPMSVSEIKRLGEQYGGRIELSEYRDYGYHIMSAETNSPAGVEGGLELTPVFYNYSLAEKQATDVLGTEDITLVGWVYDFKYKGLLFEGNGNKVLINPAQFYLPESSFEEGGLGWRYFVWSDLEPHINEWSLERFYYPENYEGGGGRKENADTDHPDKSILLQRGNSLFTEADWFQYWDENYSVVEVDYRLGSCGPVSLARMFTYYSHEILDTYNFSNNSEEGNGDFPYNHASNWEQTDPAEWFDYVVGALYYNAWGEYTNRNGDNWYWEDWRILSAGEEFVEDCGYAGDPEYVWVFDIGYTFENPYVWWDETISEIDEGDPLLLGIYDYWDRYFQVTIPGHAVTAVGYAEGGQGEPDWILVFDGFNIDCVSNPAFHYLEFATYSSNFDCFITVEPSTSTDLPPDTVGVFSACNKMIENGAKTVITWASLRETDIETFRVFKSGSSETKDILFETEGINLLNDKGYQGEFIYEEALEGNIYVEALLTNGDSVVARAK